jgi:hypothetical protein
MPSIKKVDPLQGLNQDQSGPLEKIQNGDPTSGPNRDQRSGAWESGGPGASLQKKPTGHPRAVEEHHGLRLHDPNVAAPFPPGVKGQPEPAGARDRAGTASITGGEEVKAKTG